MEEQEKVATPETEFTEDNRDDAEGGSTGNESGASEEQGGEEEQQQEVDWKALALSQKETLEQANRLLRDPRVQRVLDASDAGSPGDTTDDAAGAGDGIDEIEQALEQVEEHLRVQGPALKKYADAGDATSATTLQLLKAEKARLTGQLNFQRQMVQQIQFNNVPAEERPFVGRVLEGLKQEYGPAMADVRLAYVVSHGLQRIADLRKTKQPEKVKDADPAPKAKNESRGGGSPRPEIGGGASHAGGRFVEMTQADFDRQQSDYDDQGRHDLRRDMQARIVGKRGNKLLLRPAR